MSDAVGAILEISSPYRPIGGLIPKFTYDDCGIFYDPTAESFLYVEFSEDYKILSKQQVSPVAVISPNALDKLSDDELHNFAESDFCGEADDFSCYGFFKYC